MVEFRIKDFLEQLGGLGLMFSATRMADGTVRLNHWRNINYYENEAEIRTVWSRHMSGNDTRVQDVARYVELTQNRTRRLHT